MPQGILRRIRCGALCKLDHNYFDRTTIYYFDRTTMLYFETDETEPPKFRLITIKAHMPWYSYCTTCSQIKCPHMLVEVATLNEGLGTPDPS